MNTTLDTATPALDKLIESLTDKRSFLVGWGRTVARKAQRNARAKSQGGKFWLGIAKFTDVTSISDSAVTVECKHPAGAHKHFGGVIRARNVRYLTIPLNKEAKNLTAGDFKEGGRKLFVAPNTNVLGYSAKGKFCGLFALKESVSQKPEPWWPSDDEVLEIGIKELDKQIKL